MDTITIADKKVGKNHRPFIIAEMSGNHNQSLEKALEIVNVAADCGAHALKLQTYTPDTMTLDLNDGDFFINDKKSLWRGTSLYELYKKASTPYEWHKPIFDACRRRGLIGISTPFDSTAVDFLETLNVPAYKIASFENTDLNLVKKVASTRKPMIISTGMATVSELDETVRTARSSGCKDLILLKCTSTYPASSDSTNILTIPHMRELFDVQVGLSDHTMGIGVALASVALGTTIIEKHFTISRAEGGVDSAFSIEPQELKSLVVESERAWQSLGHVQYGPTKEEEKSLQFRRSLYIALDMQAGETFTEKNLRPVRPGYGLPPKYYDVILGKKISKSAKAGTALTWELVGP